MGLLHYVKIFALVTYVLVALYSIFFLYNLQCKLNYITEHICQQKRVDPLFNVVLPGELEARIEELD